MHPAAAFLLIPLLPLCLILAGYVLADRLAASRPAERLAVAALAGLGLLLLNCSVVNFFAPLDAARAWLCLWPAALPFVRPALLARLRSDLSGVLTTRKGLLAAVLGSVTVLSLVSPQLTQPRRAFHDSTNSHDAYFWIAGAKHLQTHHYMEIPPIDPDRPWANSAPAISGWRPAWGRAGAEGLLAVTASVLSLDPLHVYLHVNTALLAAWFAAVYLVARTFWLERLTFAGIAALFVLPSLFVYYRANANLPNLLGALMGAAALIAAARCLIPGTPRAAWLAWLVLSVHGTFFAYPEIAPFIAIPGLLLLARAAIATPRLALGVVLAVVAGLALNPATTVRAYHGLGQAFETARADAIWVNAFTRIRWPQYPPALVTQSLPAAQYLGPWLCGLASLCLLGGAFRALQRARDRYAAACTLAGCATLVVYTLLTDFNYGWQKSIQFAGVFVAALLPVAVLELAPAARNSRPLRRTIDVALAGSVAAWFGLTLVFHALEAEKWAGRRSISNDWFALADFAAARLPDADVRIEPATFSMSFFHGMWATYFLPHARLTFGPRGEFNGGYLRNTIVTAPPLPSPDTAAIFVGRTWAETFDANSPRLFTGDTFALLARSNQVVSLTGFLPAEGPPQTLASGAVLELQPHSRSELHLTLVRDEPDPSSPIAWRVTGGATTAAAPAGPGPWNLVVPLAAGQLHRLEFTAHAADPSEPMPRFKIAALRLETVP